MSGWQFSPRMKLKNSQIVMAVAAMKAIPALKRSEKATYAFTKNLAVLTAALMPLQETHQKLFKEHFGEAQTVDAKHPQFTVYQAAGKAVDETETEVVVHQIVKADLNLELNEVDHEDLAGIAFMFSDL